MSSTATEKALDEWFAGRTLDEIAENNRPNIDPSEREPTIEVMDEDGNRSAFKVRGFADTPNLRVPFVVDLARRAADFLPTSVKTEEALLRYFVRFLADRGLLGLRLTDICDPLLDSFRDWLNDQRTAVPDPTSVKPRSIHARAGGNPLEVSTKVAVMDQLLATLRRLRFDDVFADEISDDIDLIRGRDWKAEGRNHPTTILTRPQLKALVRVCRQEVVAITARLEGAWAFIAAGCEEDATRIADAELLNETHRLDHLFDGEPPVTRALFRATDDFNRANFPLLWDCDGPGYQRVLAVFSPTGRLLMPFLLLFAVYFRYNPTILTGLTPSDFTEQDSANGTRIAGAPFKNRSGRVQHASWPVTQEAHNPKQMLKTLARWTERIRPAAPEGAADRIFLARYSGGGVRTLDGQQALANALSLFLEDHQDSLSVRFTLKQLRPTVINLVYHLFDGDVIVAMHAGFHRKADTTVDHYLSDGTRKENNQALSEGVQRLIAWADSGGKADPRADRRGRADYAATPGWVCADPFGSPVPEGWGRGALTQRRTATSPCTAYGMCDYCQLGMARLDSPESYALAIKLREAIIRAKHTMPDHGWLARWAPVLDKLERKTLLNFTEEAIAAADLTIPDLPTVE